MINRVLIRIKTVQLLYSYLLVEKPFSLESQPSSPTKEKRYAYSLYLDMIYLIFRLSHIISGKKNSFPLADTRFVKKIEGDERLKSLIVKFSSGGFPFESALSPIADEIVRSLIFREFLENRDKNNFNDNIWEEIFNVIILNNREVIGIFSTLPNYSLSGVERMRELMKETFANFYATRDNIEDALSLLEHSMQKARELYMRLLLLPVELTRLRLNQLEENRKKHLPSLEDLNPKMRFVDNRVPRRIEENKSFAEYIEQNKLSWIAEDKELLEKILKSILDSEIYRRYMDDDSSSEISDTELWRELFRQVIFNNEDLLEYLESKSLFWNDDLEITGTFVLKTLKRLEDKETAEKAVLPMYKDHEDSVFGSSLFADVIRNKDVYRKYIEESVTNERWEADRLAFMDVVITMTAISEIINYPKIPLVVSINEYIEIAKSYSSSKSGAFVNGLLASVIDKLRLEGKIMK